MELSIASHGSTKPSTLKESKKEERKNDRNANVNLKDPMTVNTANVKVPRKRANANEKRLEGWQKNEVHRLTFKECKQKLYPFADEDVPKLMTLTTANIIASLVTQYKNASSSKNKS